MKQYGLIRAAAAMPRVHVADPAANAREILDMCRQTATQSPSVVVFPELSITGYTCADLFGQNRLLADAERAVAQVVAQSAELEAMAEATVAKKRPSVLDKLHAAKEFTQSQPVDGSRSKTKSQDQER